MERYHNRDCSCQRNRMIDRRNNFEDSRQGCGGWNHSHDGVDSMALAMQYVPWQHWNQVYCPEEGLQYGTIFPELNKPFYGKGACRR